MKFIRLLTVTLVLSSLNLTTQINLTYAQSSGCFSTARSVFKKANSATASHKAKKFCDRGGDSICLQRLSSRYFQEMGAIMSAVRKAEKNCK